MPGSQWEPPTRGAITQARGRLGPKVAKEVFRRVARPPASEHTEVAWLGPWRLMAIDGFVLDLPDTEPDVAEFGKDSAGGYETAFPQARVVAISECASHAIVAADVAGRWTGEQTLAYSLYERLTSDMLLTADRGFYSFYAWGWARSGGAELLWLQAGVRLDWLADLQDGSWLAMITKPRLRQARKERLRAAARDGRDLDPDEVMVVRVVDYVVPDRRGENIRLITGILEPGDATAEQLADCYHQRWEAETRSPTGRRLLLNRPKRSGSECSPGSCIAATATTPAGTAPTPAP